jgi:transposase
MERVTTIGLDLAKRVFQVHGIDTAGAVVIRRSVRRRQVLPFFAKLPGCVVDGGVRDGALLGARAR